jgi:hypothetical protein
MNRAPARSRAFICGVALLALQPVVVTAEPVAPSAAAGGVDVASMGRVLESAGYSVGAPVISGDHTLVIEARADGGRIVRAFVYRDVQTAGAAHQQAYAQQAGSVIDSLADSDDAGPQLVSGFGASTWRRNIALVQSSPETFAELMPPEVDCTDLTPVRSPDVSQAVYQVDAKIVALVDELP